MASLRTLCPLSRAYIGVPSQQANVLRLSHAIRHPASPHVTARSSPWLGGQLGTSSRTPGFHTSSKRSILPPPPQRIEGTVNDPTPIPPPTPTHGSYHWTFERLLSVSLIPLTIAPFAAGSLNPVMDAALGAALLIHSHVGFQSIIIDYIPAGRYRRARKLFWWALRAATLVVGIGVYEFETNDVGLTEAIKRIWRA